jgi:two-component system, LytTR family, sensor kinase
MSILSLDSLRRGPDRTGRLQRADAPIGRDGASATLSPKRRGLARVQIALLVVLIWTAIGAARTVPYILQPSASPWDPVDKLLDAWVWALLTPALVLVEQQLTRHDVKAYRQAILLAALSIPFTAVHVYLTAAAQYPFAGIWWSPFRSPEYTVHYFAGGWVTYCGVVCALQALKFYRRFVTSRLELERMEKRLLESRLNALRLQLEPHFLFNVLNTISSDMRTNQQVARKMIENLAELLRHTLDYIDAAEIPLSQELEILEHYLDIQKVRFGDRIRIDIDIEPEALQAVVPCMLLQPLVENAIQHGIGGRLSGGRIAISARRVGPNIVIHVRDDGVGLPPEWRLETSSGLGLRVTRERLGGLYQNPATHELAVRPLEDGGTEVIISVPLRCEGQNSDVPLSA